MNPILPDQRGTILLITQLIKRIIIIQSTDRSFRFCIFTLYQRKHTLQKGTDQRWIVSVVGGAGRSGLFWPSVTKTHLKTVIGKEKRRIRGCLWVYTTLNTTKLCWSRRQHNCLFKLLPTNSCHFDSVQILRRSRDLSDCKSSKVRWRHREGVKQRRETTGSRVSSLVECF